MSTEISYTTYLEGDFQFFRFVQFHVEVITPNLRALIRAVQIRYLRKKCSTKNTVFCLHILPVKLFVVKLPLEESRGYPP